MQTFEQWFDQDLNAPIVTRYCDTLMFSADNLSNIIGVRLYKDTRPVTVSGTVACTVIRQDGGTVTIAGTSSGNAVSATLTAACFAIPGQIAVMLQIVDGDTKVTVLRMTCNATVSATDQPIDPGMIIPSVTDLINDIETAVASIPADYSDLLAAIAPTFSASTAYAAGTYVWYNGDLYRFTAAHAVGSWTGSDAAQAVFADDVAASGDEIQDIRDALFQRTRNLYDKDACNPLDGYAYHTNGDLVETSSFATTGKIPVDAGTQYTFSAGGVSLHSVRYFSGADGATYAGTDVFNGSTVGTFTTPSGCTFAAVNLFGATHTSAQYEAAIASAQLELGSTATAYVPYRIDVLERVVKVDAQTFTDAEMAQARENIGAASAEVAAAIDEVAPLVHGKNLYDPDACGPEDQVGYWNGTKSALTAYACTGKIPVAADTQYIFSAGGVLVKYCEFFSGETGGTFISRVTLDNAAFTTPSGCTHVAIMLFARTHTTAEFEAAIAAGQLEEGDTATPYEPYSLKRQVALESVEDGEKLLSTLAVMVTASPVNLYDKALAVNGKYIMNGGIASDAGWAYTGMIPVRANTQYNLSISPAAPMKLVTAYYEYDANGTYIGVTTGGYSYLVSFVTGANTAYVAVNFTLTGHTAQDFADTIDTMMLVYGTTRPGSYYAYAPQQMADAAKISSAYADGYGAFEGKKWLATGTSLTWYDGKTYQAGVHAGEICQGYVGVISRRLGLIVTNEGINGSTLGNVSSDSLINRYTSLDWAGADIATIEYGINDFGNSVPVGAVSDAAGTGTFAACLKTVIEYALNQKPTLLLIICTDPDVRGSNVNSNNNTLKDYADVALEIADQYRLPVCDWFYRSGINALNKGGQTDDWMTADGTHPNDKGNARMGAMLARVMEEMM